MRAVEARARITRNNILFLTDFSEPSETAIPYALATAREYQATVHALHVLTPVRLPRATRESDAALIDGLEEGAQAEMQRLDSQFVGVAHETLIVRGESVWSAVEKILRDREIDLVMVGTHGRTGAIKLLLGSVAEEIFRRASVPVLTIGPSVRMGTHSGGRFHRVLFATDFTPESRAAAPYAISMVQENQAKLLLLHVMRNPDPAAAEKNRQDSVANVRFGNAPDQTLEAAKEHDADLIVLGVRDAAGRLGAATHLKRTTAHQVVAHAACPVLTVRG